MIANEPHKRHISIEVNNYMSMYGFQQCTKPMPHSPIGTVDFLNLKKRGLLSICRISNSIAYIVIKTQSHEIRLVSVVESVSLKTFDTICSLQSKLFAAFSHSFILLASQEI